MLVLMVLLLLIVAVVVVLMAIAVCSAVWCVLTLLSTSWTLAQWTLYTGGDQTHWLTHYTQTHWLTHYTQTHWHTYIETQSKALSLWKSWTIYASINFQFSLISPESWILKISQGTEQICRQCEWDGDGDVDGDCDGDECDKISQIVTHQPATIQVSHITCHITQDVCEYISCLSYI